MNHSSNLRRSRGARTLLAAIVTIVAALGVAGSATASTASLGTNKVLIYTAASGETNHVAVTVISGELWIYETGATITSETGACSIVAGHILKCPSSSVSYVRATLGDQADTFTSDAPNHWSNVYGGTGDDVLDADEGGYAVGPRSILRGEAGNDTIRTELTSIQGLGGAGNDSVSGGSGNDELMGNYGNDLIDSTHGGDYTDGGAGDDITLAGWASSDSSTHNASSGEDRISYALWANPITASLAGGFARDDSSGEDILNGFRFIIGTGGNDTLDIADGVAGGVGCGGGIDSVVVDASDSYDADCENVTVQ